MYINVMQTNSFLFICNVVITFLVFICLQLFYIIQSHWCKTQLFCLNTELFIKQTSKRYADKMFVFWKAFTFSAQPKTDGKF